ncbi:hypothetical protein ACE1AT_12020 [Pelatocladus sp. BLCC-F211]|uniref:hypothetical protein n=1 Tax=Pelatocladus sp. BLCC-F211 TaxID=3342752 RepID=UPI0035B6E1E1
MIRPPSLDDRPETSFHQRLRLLLFSRTSVAVGAILFVAIGGGVWWGWIFINQRLVPLVEKNLNQLLERPMQIGEVERFSLNSLRFGSTSIPATSTDPDRLAAEAVEVGFDLKQLLFNRTLQLNVTLVQPNRHLQKLPKYLCN